MGRIMADSKERESFDAEIDAVYRERRKTISAIAGRAGIEDGADLVQDAFVRTIERGRRGQIDSPLAFLCRVARNGVIDRFRRRAFRAGVVQEAPPDFDPPDAAPDPERAAIASDRLRRAMAIIAVMPPRRREVLLLHRMENATYGQIARRLGISPKTVENHLGAAMAQLSRALDGTGGGDDG